MQFAFLCHQNVVCESRETEIGFSYEISPSCKILAATFYEKIDDLHFFSLTTREILIPKRNFNQLSGTREGDGRGTESVS